MKSTAICFIVCEPITLQNEYQTNLQLAGHVRINVEHCDHHSLLKKLMLMQMFPSSTITPKSAMHFAVFEKLMSLKLNGYISNYAFVKTQNADNLLLCNYGMNGVSYM